MPEGLFSLSKMRLGKHRGWSHRRTGVARYLPGCVFQAIVALTRPTHKVFGSINISILPAELLHAIFELLALSDHSTLSSCMRVCRRWHDIARCYFFAVVPVGYLHVDHFSQLLRTDPGLQARHIKEIRFVDEWCQGNHQWSRHSEANRGLVDFHHPFDVRLFASTLPALGLVNLQYLSLVGFDNLNHRSPSLTPVRQSPAHGQKNPIPSISLRQLTCDECLGLTLILPSLLSLFSMDTLVIRVHPHEPSTSPWDMSTIHSSRISPASITIQNLVFEGSSWGHTELSYYQFFERILAPGSLHTLGVLAYSFGSSSPVTRLLRCGAARDLLTISVDESVFTGCPYHHGGLKLLANAIAHCTRLECFRIRLIYRSYAIPVRWTYSCCRTFEPILPNLPATLRVFALYVEVYGWRSWKDFYTAVASLKHVDDMLSPPRRGDRGGGTRFPHLQRVELNVLEGLPNDSWQMTHSKPIKGPPKPTPLPRLKAAGLLRLRVVKDVDLPLRTKRANFFLPPEMM